MNCTSNVLYLIGMHVDSASTSNNGILISNMEDSHLEALPRSYYVIESWLNISRQVYKGMKENLKMNEVLILHDFSTIHELVNEVAIFRLK